eukprot:CAMPEP_0203906016 /NCGR_PEP_ID=MMETSP0359-20131031/47697_1 /ASSEMBLY_ACC=CAM_ASM_000338 /TAXON_ID=268821 /ORGANISM="Scrippsiella Hangoei, Strain SHTV-5" /LENGTH=140 /DNA_ID=CAMNT_0050830591 /DNA_START=14 /DNA_END=433 /DNA_ORIENTATION=+
MMFDQSVSLGTRVPNNALPKALKAKKAQALKPWQVMLHERMAKEEGVNQRLLENRKPIPGWDSENNVWCHDSTTTEVGLWSSGRLVSKVGSDDSSPGACARMLVDESQAQEPSESSNLSDFGHTAAQARPKPMAQRPGQA